MITSSLRPYSHLGRIVLPGLVGRCACGVHPQDHSPLMRLDLTGAVLVDFDLSGCQAAQAVFTGACFHGPATFDHATFAVLDLTGARFHGDVVLAHVRVTTGASCTGIDVAGAATVDHASGLGAFENACFRGPASFVGTTFPARATFAHAAFHAPVDFRHATFSPPGVPGVPTVDFTAAVPDAAFTGARIGGPLTASVDGPLADHLRAAGWTPGGRLDPPPPAPLWHAPDAVRIYEDDTGAVYLAQGTETWWLGARLPGSNAGVPDDAWSSADHWWRGIWAPSERDSDTRVDEPGVRDRARHLATVGWRTPLDLHRTPQTPAAVAFLALPESQERPSC
jgi:hypothetical protein